MHLATSGLAILIALGVLFGLIMLESFLIMIIWNKIIIKKFPLSNIQELNIWESLAISVFTALLFKGYAVVNTQNIQYFQ